MLNIFLQSKRTSVVFNKMENKLLLAVAVALAAFAGRILLVIYYWTIRLHVWMYVFLIAKDKTHIIEYLWDFAMLNILTLVNSYTFVKQMHRALKFVFLFYFRSLNQDCKSCLQVYNCEQVQVFRNEEKKATRWEYCLFWLTNIYCHKDTSTAG